jgi:hypothetical protein
MKQILSLHNLSIGLVILMLSSGCGTDANPASTQSNSKPQNLQQEKNEPLQVTPKGIIKKPDGTLALSKAGLSIRTTPATEGPEEVAWRFFKLENEQNYEEAAKLLTGYFYHSLYDEPGQKYLKEIIGAEFIRSADITSIAPRENETADAYDYRVIYIEVNLKLRGAIPPDQTGYRNGFKNFAVHLIQAKQGDPWKIVLLGGSPTLEN